MIRYAHICLHLFQRYVATPPSARHVCWKIWNAPKTSRNQKKLWISGIIHPRRFLANICQLLTCNAFQIATEEAPAEWCDYNGLVSWYSMVHTDSKKAPHWPHQVGPWALHVDNLPWHMEEVSLSPVTKQQRSEVKPCMSSHVVLPEEHWRFWQPFCLGANEA